MAIPNLTVHNTVVIANVGQIVKSVVANIAGNDISNAINGSKATAEVIHSLVKQRLQAKLAAAK
jgi:hypothetical protein